jgi:branched-chain amino acid transport system permease protein
MLFWNLLTNGVVIGCGYALVALGFGLIYGTTRIFHFAHGAVYTLSAYTFYLLREWGGLRLPAAALITLAAAAVLGVLIDELFYRGLVRRGAPLLVLMLSSLGLYTIAVNAVALFFGSDVVVFVKQADVMWGVGPLSVTKYQALTVIAFASLYVALAVLMMYTVAGKLVRAARDSPELVSALGYDMRHVHWAVFSVGSVFAAVAAILQGLDLGLTPHVGLNALLTAAVAVILGGIGRFRGAVAGAFTLGVLQSLVTLAFSSRWVEAVSFTALIVFLIYRKEGIFKTLRRVEEQAA